MAAGDGPGGPGTGRAGHGRAGGSAAVRLGLAVLLAAAITVVLVIVGRVHQPNYAATIFGQSALGALALKSWLATVALGLAFVQVVLALWLYRKLPFAPAPPGAGRSAVPVTWSESSSTCRLSWPWRL
jgi:hypothetical protein